MDGCIAERPKLLIWSKNTYKQEKKKKKKKKTPKGMGKVDAGRRRRDQICSLLLSDLFSEK